MSVRLMNLSRSYCDFPTYRDEVEPIFLNFYSTRACLKKFIGHFFSKQRLTMLPQLQSIDNVTISEFFRGLCTHGTGTNLLESDHGPSKGKTQYLRSSAFSWPACDMPSLVYGDAAVAEDSVELS